jgi:cell division protein FtsL
MTRLGIVFWLVLVLAAGFTTFRVKYAVQDLEDELKRVQRQTIAEQQEIRVLTAEWTYLTQPERLAELNKRFLRLATVSAKQLRRGIEDIPLRPVAAPSETPAETAPEPAPAMPDPLAQPVAAEAAAAPAESLDALITQVQLAKAETAASPGSLDALIAQIADTR